MYALFVTVLCALAIVGSAKDSVERECCRNIGAFKECRRECRKVGAEKKPSKKVQLALSLPKVCPSHLDNLWKCFNSSVKGLHLYVNLNLKLIGKSCCLLANHDSCREACFLATNVKDLQQSCPKVEEESLLRCIDRNKASQKCCQHNKKRCVKACQIVFSSDKEPNKEKIRAVKRKCGKNNHVFRCVKNVAGSTRTSTLPNHKCCQMTDNIKCQDVCRQVMSSKEPDTEKMKLLEKSCHVLPFYHKFWPCIFTFAVRPSSGIEDPRQNPVDKVDIRLHCCLRANNDECLKLCLKRYSEGGGAIQEFHRRCGFNTKETTMLTCIADVSTPCHIGCSGLKFCTNFNHRHTELFRSCNKEADEKAKYDFKNWWEKGGVVIPAMDVIPVKDIKKCLPETWKAIACMLQIKPCNVKSHGTVICRKDCLKVLGQCAKIPELGTRSVEDICKGLSPDEQSSCISIEDYIRPSLFKQETPKVTLPCYPNPCKNKDVCEINRERPGMNSKNFVPYLCTPGCAIDLQSKLFIRNGDLARLPIVQNSKLEECYKICRCDKERLSDCPRLPNCVQQKSCHIKGSKESYKHQDKFYINCNFCSCFDGKVLCSKKECFGALYNGTGRPRRNHSPTNSSHVHTTTGLPCSCSGNYSAVCGTNGKTYRNYCFARCATLKQSQISNGPCSSTNPCSRSPCDGNKICVVDRKICIGADSICPQYVCVPRQKDCSNATRELICDNKNNQHFDRCSFYKTGNEIAYSGVCKTSCTPGRKEVCGIDGQTYSSICALNHAHMLMDYEGPCTTIGKYTDEDPTVRCEYIKCPLLKPDNCVGVTPPGACCKVCASKLVVLFSEAEVIKTNKIVMLQTQPITQKQIVARVRRHLSVSECDLFGYYSIHRDFVLLVKAITENPTKLQFTICNKEAQKIETLVHISSPMFTSDGILSSFRAVSLTTPKLSDKNAAKVVSHSSRQSLMLLLLLVSLLLSWPR